MSMLADDGNESPPAKTTIAPVATRCMSTTVDLAQRSTIAPETLADGSGRDEGDDGGEQREGEHESEREGDESRDFDESDGDDEGKMTAQRIAVTTAKEVFGDVGRVVEVPGAFVGDSGREGQSGDDKQYHKREGEEGEDGGNEDQEGESSDYGREESDGEGEYDWAAEAQKPPKTKGYQYNWQSSQFRTRKMVWEKRDGRWHGEWRWTKWEYKSEWNERIENDRERAIRAWNVAGTPQEVLLLVIECLVGRRRPVTLEYSHDMYWVEGLHNLAFVCRVWRILIEPALFSTLRVRDKVLGSPLRHSLAQHARTIKVASVRPIITSARLTQSAPHPSPAVVLIWEGPGQKGDREAAAYHPSHAVIYTQLHRSYSNVTELNLWRCTFLSSSDLLRLLASFSALECVQLWSVSVAHVSDSVILRGRSSTGVSRSILVGIDCTPSWLPFFTRCWTWPCKPSNQQTPPFHGLILAEQRLAARFVGFVGGTGSNFKVWYHLDAMDTGSATWVAWMEMIPLHVEFHALQHDSLRPAAAYVQHCLLRVRYNSTVQALTKGLTTIGDIFTRFAYLESVILETGSWVRTYKIQPLLESLRKNCRVEVQHRTCDEALKLALQEKKSPSRSARAGLLSPFWCLEEVGRWRDWLSDHYRESLKDEDKQGWDPSRSRTTSPAASK